MKKIILTYGAISGAIIIGSLLLGLWLDHAEGGMGSSVWLGYLIMLVALSVIFVGVKRYRDQELGGVIRFGTAFLVGLGISAVASVIYVGVWEIYLAQTDYAFMDQYTAMLIESKKAAGASAAELQELTTNMESMKEKYASPFFRVPMTLLEIFPVGLLVSLIAAAVLRKSRVLPAGGEPATSSAG